MISFRTACHLWATWRFRNYRPQPITRLTVDAWLDQFGEKHHRHLFTLLRHVKYVQREEAHSDLARLNRVLLRELKGRGVEPDHVIYIQIDDAASSSPLMLKVLRDDERLRALGCKFIDSKNADELLRTTFELEFGAIIYVDDFSGTGNQFCESRDMVSAQIVGDWSEFFLVPYICEEAIEKLGDRGIEHRSKEEHLKVDRLLHPNCDKCRSQTKDELMLLSERISRRYPLGYKNLGTMLVFSTHCPNTSPVLLRGSKGQHPFVGILPNPDDLPPHQI